MEKLDYRLYAVFPEDVPENEPYYIATPDWCLLFTENEPKGKHREITKAAQLPPLAKQWLVGVIEEIQKKYLAEHEKELLCRAKQFRDKFAAELAVEQEKQNATEKEGGFVEQTGATD